MPKDQQPLFSVEQHDDVLVVIPMEDAGSLIDRQIRQEWEQILADSEEPVARIVLDLKKMHYFGSVMLEWMISVWRHVQQHKGAFAACNASTVGGEILKIAKFDSLWPIFNTREEAIEWVRAQP